MTTRLPEKLKTLPDVPKEFGDDGGKFYRYYDELADDLDEDLVKSLKAQLDGILIFAGLFAGVNSAFLAFTLPQMTADSADDTNALLLQILLGGNSSITSAADLPSASFTPPPRIYPINVLFSVSLTLALLSSFLAVLGQQWIVYYRKRSGGGPEHQRWEQLRRALGAKRWRLQLVLDDLVPSMLQLGLIIFCIAFSLYLGTLSKSLSFIIGAILCTAFIVILAMTTCAAFDTWCPFRTSLSRTIVPIVCRLSTFILSCAFLILVVPLFVLLQILARVGGLSDPPDLEDLWKVLSDPATPYNDLYMNIVKVVMRPADDPEYLKAEAIKRVICISEDRTAMVHAAVNLQTIKNPRYLSSLLEDDEFLIRMFELGGTGSHQDQSQRPHNTELMEARAFSTSFFHVWLSAGSFSRIVDILLSDHNLGSRELATDVAFSTIGGLCRGALVPFTADCDRCVHCATLSFSIRVVRLLVDDGRRRLLSFDDVFNEVEGALTKSVDLRLGCVGAAAVLCSKMSRDLGFTGPSYEETSLRHFDLLSGELSKAYRARDDSQMIEVIGRGLATVESKWNGQPDHELYVRLFELGLSSGIAVSKAYPILEHFGTLLLSIENRIRDQATSERDGQTGREHQNRCLQAVLGCSKQPDDRNSEFWDSVGPSVESYMKGVKEQVAADPANPKNPPTVDFLRRIKASFPEPVSGRPAYAKLCELLDQIETVSQTTNHEGVVVQSTGFFSGNTDAVESTGTRSARHAPPILWGN